MRLLTIVVVLFAGWLGPRPPTASAADPFLGADSIWVLLHEPEVIRDLALKPDQLSRYRSLIDRADARFFPLRNQPGVPAAKAAQAILDEIAAELRNVLAEPQLRRLAEIQARYEGTAAVVRPDFAARLGYTAAQREKVEQRIKATGEAMANLQARFAQGESQQSLEKEYADLKRNELRDVAEILTPAQRSLWQQSLGSEFDLGKLGRPTYKPPEFVDSGVWLNAKPVTLERLSGKVVVVHFYAFGCRNCVNNFSAYQAWQKRFQGKDVAIIGIHTPETAAEEQPAAVAQKAKEAGLGFPVLVDGKKANWNAWGNSIWPSVYVVDKWGRLRYFWPGELTWKGATGDQWIADRIDEMLVERESPTPGG